MIDLRDKKNSKLNINGLNIFVSYGNPNNIICDIKCLDKNKYDIVIKINTKYDVAVVWNINYRRQCNKLVNHLEYSKDNWDNIVSNDYEIFYKRKYMGNVGGSPLEIVLAMKVDILNQNIYDIPYLLLFDGINYVKEDNLEQEKVDEFNNYFERKKHSIEVYNRNARFRKDVLDNYNNKYAICRCNEVKILQAAHIKGVSNNGSDDIRNGICLCANHHLMFDNNLIKIDFNKLIIYDVSDSIKSMAWYNEFNDKYNGKILKGKNINYKK